MTSTVRIDLKSSPLKDTLRLLLDQLDLAYVVKDDVLMIISQVGTAAGRQKESPAMASDTEPRTKLVIDMLGSQSSMSFNEDTPTRGRPEVRQASTKSDNSPGIEIYVNQKGLKEGRENP